jgi:hypothetical protein
METAPEHIIGYFATQRNCIGENLAAPQPFVTTSIERQCNNTGGLYRGTLLDEKKYPTLVEHP